MGDDQGLDTTYEVGVTDPLHGIVFTSMDDTWPLSEGQCICHANMGQAGNGCEDRFERTHGEWFIPS